MSKAKHIGIVACSAEGAALCYRTICVEAEEMMGKHDHPEVSMHTHSLAEYMKCIDEKNWQGVAELMLSSAEKLAKCGAEFLICPDNTIHQAMPLVRPRSPLPWLHIAGAVGTEAIRRGYRQLGITGTKYLVESSVYPQELEKRGIGWLRPKDDEREEINRIIFDELVRARFTPEALSYFQQVIESLKRRGCDAVVLGCTEIPLLVNNENSPLPVLDSTRLLARAALRASCEL
ncbi:MAG: amino acid racemase [Acidobacteriia bacterium]|nr:amino acid racemase [Terriglobia bacterium]